MPASTYPQTHRVGKVLLTPELLHSLLDVPDDLRIVRIHARSDPDSVVLPVNSEAPFLSAAWATESVEVDGKRFVRLAWNS